VIVLGLGGNIGGEVAVRERFVRAREAFGELGTVRSAALYRTAPVGPAQDDFLNTALGVTAAGVIAGELIATVLEIERLLGRDRRREERWGPRTIDIDVLAWEHRTLRSPELEVPHPRACERLFALLPLIDLLGEDATLPGQHETLAALAARHRDQRVKLIASSW